MAPSFSSPSAFFSSPSAGAPSAAAPSAGAASSTFSALGTETVKSVRSASSRISTPAGTFRSEILTLSPMLSPLTSTVIASGRSVGRHSTSTSRRICSRIPPSVTPTGSPVRTMATCATSFSVIEIAAKSTWITASLILSRWTSFTITVFLNGASSPSPEIWRSMIELSPPLPCRILCNSLPSTPIKMFSFTSP